MGFMSAGDFLGVVGPTNLDNNKKSKSKSKKADDDDESKQKEVIVDDLSKDLMELANSDKAQIERISNIGAMPVEEKLKLLQEDSPELLKLLSEFKDKLREIKDVIEPILKQVKEGALPTSKGISFLELKHQLLLNYCMNISFYLMLKANGKQVKDHPVIDQLVKVRVTLDKMKPLEMKLKHQIEKLVRAAHLGVTLPDDDPLRFKPNPHAMMEVDIDPEQANVDGIYKPPRILAQELEDERAEVKKQEKRKRQSRRALDSEMAKFIQEEYGDKPYETGEGVSTKVFEEDEEERLRREYEEESFHRLPVTRKDRRKQMEKIQNMNTNLNNLEDFGDLAVLDEEERQKRADEEYLKQKRMDHIMRQLEEAKGKGKGKGKINKDEIIDSDSDMEEPQPKKQAREKPDRTPRWTQGPVPSEEKKLESGAHRKIDKAIMSNRGLTRSRNKNLKNANLKNRHKYDVAMKKRKGVVPVARDARQPYDGEKNISKNVVKSKSLVHTGL